MIRLEFMIDNVSYQANVMISSDGTALIADFGNAELRDLTLKFTNSSKLGLSVRWAAPELLVPEACPQATKEADVYAFGMTVLEVLTGKVPFHGTKEYQILCLVARRGKVPPRPDIGMHDDLWDLLNWCWTRDPAKRPGISSIKDRLQALFPPPFDAWSIKDTTTQSQGNEFNSRRRENAGDAVSGTHAGPLEGTREPVGEDSEGEEESMQRYLRSEFGDQSGHNYSDYEEEESEEELSEETESRAEDSDNIASDLQRQHLSSQEDPNYPYHDRDNQSQTTSVPTIAINSSPNDSNVPSILTSITDGDRLNPTYQPPEHAPRAFLDSNTSYGGIQLTRPVERVHVTVPATREASSNRRTAQANFKCPVPGCGSTFTRHFNLRGHIRSHNVEKPFKCKWPGCDKGFAREHDCKRHEALHLNIRPYTCEGCNKTFARMDALNRHLRSEGGAECRRVQSEVTEAHLPENTTQADRQLSSGNVVV